MANFQKLLARIEAKLNLVYVLISEQETKIPTVIARIKQAQVHLQQKDLPTLYLDLEWITKVMLSKKALRRLGEHQMIDLQLLKKELGRYVTAEKPASQLAAAIPRWRGRILRALQHLEDDVIILREKTATITTYELARTIIDFQNAEKKMKEQLFVPTIHSEQEIMTLLSLLTQEMQTINAILLNIQIGLVQAWRKVLLQDWNKLIDGLEALFKDAYKEIKPVARVLVVKSEQGPQRLEIQPQL